MNIRYLVLLYCLLFGQLAFGQFVTSTKVFKAEGVGEGTSRSEAVNEAIVEAVGQITGVRISKKTIIENLEIENEKGNSLSLNYNAKIQKATSGKADSYKILHVDKKPNGLYRAKVLVTNTKTTKRYKAPGLSVHNRKKIIIVPAQSTSKSFPINGVHKRSATITKDLVEHMTNKVTQTRKFSVLDRAHNSSYQDEKSLILSSDAQKDEILKLKGVVGTDYIFVVSVKNFSIGKKVNKYVATASNSFNVNADIQYKIIVLSTRQVKLSTTKQFNFDLSNIGSNQAYTEALNDVSSQITAQMVENIFPLKVIDSSNNQITLNQGNIDVGTKYDVYQLGKKLYDSYTKEYLGRSESKVGTVEIIRTLPKVSIAKIVDGSVKKGNLCRLITTGSAQESYENIGRESDVGITQNGGVVLPF